MQHSKFEATCIKRSYPGRFINCTLTRENVVVGMIVIKVLAILSIE
jgi:hypothetical protein